VKLSNAQSEYVYIGYVQGVTSLESSSSSQSGIAFYRLLHDESRNLFCTHPISSFYLPVDETLNAKACPKQILGNTVE